METLLEIKNLFIRFKSQKNIVYAVNDLSFSVYKKEILGIIGESGCGKLITDKHLLFRVRRREANINRKAEK